MVTIFAVHSESGDCRKIRTAKGYKDAWAYITSGDDRGWPEGFDAFVLDAGGAVLWWDGVSDDFVLADSADAEIVRANAERRYFISRIYDGTFTGKVHVVKETRGDAARALCGYENSERTSAVFLSSQGVCELARSHGGSICAACSRLARRGEGA